MEGAEQAWAVWFLSGSSLHSQDASLVFALTELLWESLVAHLLRWFSPPQKRAFMEVSLEQGAARERRLGLREEVSDKNSCREHTSSLWNTR